MAQQRRGARERGKSDLIDAIAVARAALRDGLDRLPVAELAGGELDIRLLVDIASASCTSGPAFTTTFCIPSSDAEVQ